LLPTISKVPALVPTQSSNGSRVVSKLIGADPGLAASDLRWRSSLVGGVSKHEEP
jgi:hypothetical protein